jgi:hypothetical protein
MRLRSFSYSSPDPYAWGNVNGRAPCAHVSAIEQLDARLRTAKRDVTLGYFNCEFRQRRLQAQAEGRSFMPYAAAQTEGLVAAPVARQTGRVAQCSLTVSDSCL